MSVLVTGAGGFIGRRMVAWLAARGIAATGWTRADVDLEDAAAVADAVAALDPAIILHLAAIPARSSDSDWRLIAREAAMVDALAAALPFGATLVCCGSMAEIGHSGIHDEHVQCRPHTLYGMAKYAGTSRALAMVAEGRSIRVARLFGVYGPGEGPQRLIPSLVSRLARAEPVMLSDGLQVRDFVHVDDVCAALWALASAPDGGAPGLVNVGTGQGISVADVCRSVADALGADHALLHFGAIERRYVDETELVARVGPWLRSAGLDSQAIWPTPAFLDYVHALAVPALPGSDG